MSRAQNVTDADQDIQRLLVAIAGNLGEFLSDALVGVYVYGSLAMGSFRRERSDLNVLAVVRGKLRPEMREGLERLLLRLSDSRRIAGDIDIVVMQERYAREYEHPIPFEFHYNSSNCDSIEPAACLIGARERGVRLFGPEPRAMFGPVPWFAYMNAVQVAFERAGRCAAKEPVEAVLNACRTLHATTQRDLEVVPKDEAALRLLSILPEPLAPMVREAVNAYRGAPETFAFEIGQVTALRAFVLERARPAFERASDTDDSDE
ncbi:MAG: DUF4111 domain-containing protein [Candidatus Eremiobacteraeota bacterium]|nr:DUF4111 domain-containing protein [Candidatus Eremiobacteraeota bacterium]